MNCGKAVAKESCWGGEGRVTPYLLSSLPSLLFFPKGLLPRSCQTNFQRLIAWHSLAVQGRLLASSAGSMGPITGRGTKILNAAQCGQINISVFLFFFFLKAHCFRMSSSKEGYFFKNTRKPKRVLKTQRRELSPGHLGPENNGGVGVDLAEALHFLSHDRSTSPPTGFI